MQPRVVLNFAAMCQFQPTRLLESSEGRAFSASLSLASLALRALFSVSQVALHGTVKICQRMGAWLQGCKNVWVRGCTAAQANGKGAWHMHAAYAQNLHFCNQRLLCLSLGRFPVIEGMPVLTIPRELLNVRVVQMAKSEPGKR